MDDVRAALSVACDLLAAEEGLQFVVGGFGDREGAVDVPTDLLVAPAKNGRRHTCRRPDQSARTTRADGIFTNESSLDGSRVGPRRPEPRPSAGAWRGDDLAGLELQWV